MEELKRLYEKKHPPDRPLPTTQRVELDEDDEEEGSSESEEDDGEGEQGEGKEKDQDEPMPQRTRIVDEDGWEVVTHKGRGRKNK